MTTFSTQDYEDLANCVGNRLCELNDREPKDANDEFETSKLIDRLEHLLWLCNDQHRDNILRRVMERTEERILKFMNDIRDALNAEGMATGEPFDMHDDFYRYSMSCWNSPKPKPQDNSDAFDITVEIFEAGGGTDSESFYGINFNLGIVEYGGAIIGMYSPYNYTPDVWVDARDDEAVDDRLRLFLSIDIPGIVDGIMEHYKARDAA